MEYVEKKVSVPKEVSELADGVVKIVIAIKNAMADGWNLGQDLPIIVTTALAVLPTAIDGFDKLGEESKDESAFTMAFLLAAKDIYTSFEKK
jgi:hypothetical protein